MAWTTVSIGDHLLKTELRDPTKRPQDRFFYVDVSSVDNRAFAIRQPTELWGTDAPSRARKVIRARDILFATVRPTLRRIALVGESLDDQVCSTGFCVLRTGSGLDPRFLYYALLTDDVVEHVGRIEKGVSYPAIRDSDVKAIRIPYPPLGEQRRIAAVLSAVQRAIERQDRLLALTAELKKALMHKLFTEGTRGELQKQTEIGPVPFSWRLRRCDELCEVVSVGVVVRPRSYYVDTGVPAFRSQNVREDYLDTTDIVYFSEVTNRGALSKSRLRTGDVLIVRTGYPGTSCVVPPEYDGANCIDIVFARPGPDILSDYLSRFLNSERGKAQATVAKHGLAQQHLNVAAVKRVQVPLPTPDEQAAIVEALAAVDRKRTVHVRHAASLRVLFRTLLHQLMAAQIRVHDLDLSALEEAEQEPVGVV
jgi:type I restriction enzyme, S subunit